MKLSCCGASLPRIPNRPPRTDRTFEPPSDTLPAVAGLFILAHGGSWEMRFQVSSLAASAAAAGERVDVALFFGALDAWARSRWDEIDPQPPLSVERVEASGMPPLSEMLAMGREDDLIRIYACSASTRLLGLDRAMVQDSVDALLGWQSFARMIREAGRVVTL